MYTGIFLFYPLFHWNFCGTMAQTFKEGVCSMAKKKRTLPPFAAMTVGTLLVSLGVYFFKFPNNFSFGGVTGLAVVVAPYLPISASDFTFIANVLLLLLGFVFLGRSFGVKTIYTSLLMSISLTLLERIFPLSAPLTSEPVLELGFAIALPAVGAALLFSVGASGGGTDVIAMILKKYTSIDIGQALFFSDLLFVLMGGLLFGVETFLFSFAGLLIKSLLIDNVIASMNQVKWLQVICSHPEEICRFITEDLKRSATLSSGTGAFTGEERSILFTAMTPREARRLQQFIADADPSAFVMISTTHEIMGRGF